MLLAIIGGNKMAEKRMFSKTIIDSDAFLDMPLSSQALYFHLSMRADDDGFVNNPKKIQRLTGCGDDDLKLLMAKKFLIPFESGIVVIKHWRIHNYIRGDRYKETNYIEEKSMLGIEKNKAYSLLVENKDCTPLISLSKNGMSNGIPTVDNLDTQIRIDKNSIDKNSIEEYTAAEPPHASETPLIDNTEKPQKHKYGIFNHVLLLDDEMSKLVSEYGLVETQQAIKYLDEYIEMKGVKYKSHYLALKKWVYDAVKEQKQRSQKIQPAKLNSFNNVSSLQRESPQFDTIAELIENGAFD